MILKKLVFFAAAALMLLSMSGCEKDNVRNSDGENIVARFSVEIPDKVRTKSVGDGDHTDIVYYEVWSADFTTVLFSSYSMFSAPGVAELDIAMVKDQTYNLIFWAQDNSEKSPYSWDNLKKVEVDYSKFTSNNKDCYDAFYAVTEIVADGTPKIVKLYRPFGQLNVGTSTMETAFGEFSITGHSVTVSQYAKAFDTVSGTAVDYVNAPMTFTASEGGLVEKGESDDKGLGIDDMSYYWVAMNYLLVPSQTEATVTVDMTFNTTGGKVSHSVINVPLKQNYRTNIVGDLFTTSSKLTVVVVPGFTDDFNGPDFNRNN